MADTQTPNILLTNQQEGGNDNTWGTIADANFELLDNVLGDTTDISTTGGNTTLNDAQSLVAAIQVAGVLATNAEIRFPARGGFWIIENNTTGAFTVTAKVTGQTGVVIPQGESRIVFCDGTDIKLGNNIEQISDFDTDDTTFTQNAVAPVGWSKITTNTDKALRLTSGTAGVTGGTLAFSSTFAASRMIAALNLPDHTVTITDNKTGTVTAQQMSGAAGSDNGIYNHVLVDAAASQSHGAQTTPLSVVFSGAITAAFGTTARGGAQTKFDMEVQYVDINAIEKD